VQQLGSQRVLVMESDPRFSRMIKGLLRKWGHDAIGPVARPDQAFPPALQAELTLAVLDIDDDGSTVYALADTLSFRSIPLVFTARDASARLPVRFDGYPVLRKRFSRQSFQDAVTQAYERQWA
jgi:hypothetical protein